jgi:hypothetical protein
MTDVGLGNKASSGPVFKLQDHKKIYERSGARKHFYKTFRRLSNSSISDLKYFSFV